MKEFPKAIYHEKGYTVVENKEDEEVLLKKIKGESKDGTSKDNTKRTSKKSS